MVASARPPLTHMVPRVSRRATRIRSALRNYSTCSRVGVANALPGLRTSSLNGLAPHCRARIPHPRTWAVSIQLHEPRWLWREESLEQQGNPRRSVRAGPDVRNGVAQLVEAAIA